MCKRPCEQQRRPRRHPHDLDSTKPRRGEAGLPRSLTRTNTSASKGTREGRYSHTKYSAPQQVTRGQGSWVQWGQLEKPQEKAKGLRYRPVQVAQVFPPAPRARSGSTSKGSTFPLRMEPRTAPPWEMRQTILLSLSAAYGLGFTD